MGWEGDSGWGVGGVKGSVTLGGPGSDHGNGGRFRLRLIKSESKVRFRIGRHISRFKDGPAFVMTRRGKSGTGDGAWGGGGGGRDRNGKGGERSWEGGRVGGGGGGRSNLVFCAQSAATVINIGHEEGGDEKGIENYERRRLGEQNI